MKIEFNHQPPEDEPKDVADLGIIEDRRPLFQADYPVSSRVHPPMSKSKNPKLHVYDPQEDNRSPFLRGILTRSLQTAGLDFDEAYAIASKIRSDLEGRDEVSSPKLSEIVIEHLMKKGYRIIADRYRKCSPVTHIRVRGQDGQYQSFSKVFLGRSLEICAFPEDRCYQITSQIEQQLKNANKMEITSDELARMTHRFLLHHESAEAAKRYLVWREFSHGDKPLFLLVGGATGCGKSTLAAEIANRLGIVRIQSTDMLREVMRLLIPIRLLPGLHSSTFNSWRTLPSTEDHPVTFETHLLDGYLQQAEQIGVGIEGVLHRAQREKVPLIIEGVHIFPAMQHRLAQNDEVIFVPFLLAVLKKNQLIGRLKGRGREVSSRRVERYLKNFPAIWQLQSYLLSEADRFEIPIIANNDEATTILQVMDTIAERLMKEYEGDPKKVLHERASTASEAKK